MRLQNYKNIRILSRFEWLETSFSSLNVTQRRTDYTVSVLNKAVDFLKSNLVNENTALEQQLTKTVLGISASLKEKCQSGEFGPIAFDPRPSYPATVTITFRPAFRSIPAVVYGLKMLDSAYNANVRVKGPITELTNTYFDFRISEWADNVMYGSVFSWMACT
ncbi:LOW QUALITY PROTEIN: hypothetical protein MAR_026977 [Mya arenaria]|uniref:H-type lectin domain-containing protein n=1 Tax=Mya arenaria TaxID=6604 RepID=A0ABY7EU86_MYAAR|nr:LOW QUALITY PROTEIN: hypothetical protein MAR_026977 [Mya arenaria]